MILRKGTQRMHIYNHENLFITNKYYKWYYSIIVNALNQNRKKFKITSKNYRYFEIHHILPRSIFPQYKSLKENQWNKVLLTAKEHFVCHLLLPKFVTNDIHKFKMVHALYAMTKQNNNQQQRNNSKMYEYAKKAMIAIRNDKDASKEWRKKLSLASKKSNHMIGKTREKNPFFGKKHSTETRKLMSEKAKLRRASEETKEKMKGERGKQKNPAPILECPHCKIFVKKGNVFIKFIIETAHTPIP
jgi:hypothetical protein